MEVFQLAQSLIRSWWARFRGQLEPVPCPFSDTAILETPLRALVASPARVLGAFDLRPGDCVLEIGPGIGYYSVEAARRVGAQGRLICLDLQRDMLLKVQRRLQQNGLRENVDLICASATDIPLESNSVDHVLLITVLGEIPDRPRALGEIQRVLRLNGELSVSEQLPDPDFVTRRTLRQELSVAGFRERATHGHLFYTSTWNVINSEVKQALGQS